MIRTPVQSTSCTVEIVTPEGVRLLFDTHEADSDLLRVETHNDLAEACGSFTLTLLPRRIHGRTYDQLIPLRSQVLITMQGAQDELTSTDTTVMVGLTEDHGKTEDYSRAQPQRVVTIIGRSIACVLLDAHLRFHPGLENKPEGMLAVEDALFRLAWPVNLLTEHMDPRDALRTILRHFLGVPSHIEPQTLTARLETQQTAETLRQQQPGVPTRDIATQARQARSLATRAPVQVQAIPQAAETLEAGQQAVDELERLIKQYPNAPRRELTAALLARIETAEALKAGFPAETIAETSMVHKRLEARAQQALKTQALPPTPPAPTDPTAQAVRGNNVLLNLQLPGKTLADLFDMNDHTWTLFEDGVTIQNLHNTPYAGSLWNAIGQYVDHLFQEFFSRMEDGVCKLYFRGKPFLDTDSLTGSRFRDDDPTCPTLELSQPAWEAIYLGGSERRQAANIYNFFTVLPLDTSGMFDHPSYKYIALPVLLTDPGHPSYLAKYGVRELDHRSSYLPGLPTIPSTPSGETQDNMIEAAKRWETKASQWYGLAPEMYAGMMSVLGSPRWQPGIRLVYSDERGVREGYLEGVNHTYDMRTGRFVSQLRVTRLWYLSGRVDERESSGEEIHVEPFS